MRTLFKNERGDFGITGLLMLIFVIGTLVGTYWILTEHTDVFGPEDTELPSEEEVLQWKSFGCWEADEETATHIDSRSGPVFECLYTMELYSYDFRMARIGSGSKSYQARVYEWDGVESEPGDYIGCTSWVHFNDLVESPGTQCLQPVQVFYWQDEIVLFGDVQYVIWMYQTPGEGMCRMMNGEAPGCCSGPTMGYWWNVNTSYHVGSVMDYWLVGHQVYEPNVMTVGYVLETDGSISLEGWSDVVGNMECGFFVSDVEADVTAGQGVRYIAGESGLEVSRYYFDYRIVRMVSDVVYYYRAYAETQGQMWFGAVKNFTRATGDVAVGLVCEVLTNDIDGVEFNTVLMGSHDGVIYDIDIYYAETVELLQSHNFSVAVVVGASADGTWRTVTDSDDWESGARYYYRARGEGDDSSIGYSPTRWFTRYDATQPPAVNWLVRWFNISFESMWWALAVVLLLVVWVIAGMNRWWWMGVIGTAIILIALVTFGFVSPWVVVLLALIAGWIVFKIVFHKSGGTGS